MDAKTKKEVDAIVAELDSIIKELKDISSGVKKDFKNIGNEQCSACIDRAVDNYKYVRKKLDNMDSSKLKEGFKKLVGG